MQYATDIVSVIAYGGEITYASPAIVDILGCPPEAVVGTNAYDLVHPDDMATVDKALDVLLMNPTQPVTFEMRVRNIDGSYRWIQATCTNQIDEPSVGGIVGNFRDVDERKRAAAFSTSETLALEMLLAGRPLPHTFRVLLQGLEDYVGTRTRRSGWSRRRPAPSTWRRPPCPTSSRPRHRPVPPTVVRRSRRSTARRAHRDQRHRDRRAPRGARPRPPARVPHGLVGAGREPRRRTRSSRSSTSTSPTTDARPRPNAPSSTHA